MLLRGEVKGTGLLFCMGVDGRLGAGLLVIPVVGVLAAPATIPLLAVIVLPPTGAEPDPPPLP